MTVLPEILQSDDALQRVVSFARRYGEAHILLAMHAALPVGLTPDLLHLMRINFANSAPWIAEADLLLSPLCREVGGDLYEMEPEVRELLLNELRDDPEFGSAHIREVAEFLIEYSVRAVKGAAPYTTPELRDFFKAQEWVGMAYARPEEAVRALASALRDELLANNKGEIIRIAGLTGVLTAPLLSEQKMLLYFAGVSKAISGDNLAAQGLFEALGTLNQTVNIGGVQLPAPISLQYAALESLQEKIKFKSDSQEEGLDAMYNQEYDPNRFTQQQINHGQARLNYQLCVVDFQVIETLKGVLDIVKAIAAVPAIAPHLDGVDFGKMEAAIADAYKTNVRVPDIKPPGCEPPPPTYA